MSRTVNCTEDIIVVSDGEKDTGKLAALWGTGKFHPSVIPAIDELQDQINKEVTERTEGDKALQSNIDAEASARTTADKNLRDQISKEIEVRTDGDTALQSSVDKEVVARTDTDSKLQSSIDVEVEARIKADQDLQDQVTNEIAARTNADETESTARLSAVQELQNKIDALEGKNAFSNVVVNGTTIKADSPEDTIELEAGTNIALTADTANGKVTIAVTGKVASAAQADSATTAESCTGNVATATKLEIARNINGVAFDGTKDITITATANGGNADTIGGYTPNNLMPLGAIIMWSGSIAAIPSKWALCNGSNGTPDLRDRFIVCAGKSYVVGSAGGEAAHTLTVAEMPAHTHTTTFIRDQCSGISGNAVLGDEYRDGTQNVTSQSTGGDQAHNNMPPYYALAYIIRIA